MSENTPNIKNYFDLLADTENTWEGEESLEELLFDCDNLLEEAVSKSFLVPIRKGDIIMANNGQSNREGGMPILSEHRVYVVEDVTGEYGSRTFKGYLLSSRVQKANYYNKKFPNNIYIENYSSILAKGPANDKEAFINLADLYEIDERLMNRESSLWKGHAKQSFIDFIDNAVAAKSRGESTEEIFWLQDNA